jgi:ABC-type dipeptide/oligopeptide/nickel transport system ATPase component
MPKVSKSSNLRRVARRVVASATLAVPAKELPAITQEDDTEINEADGLSRGQRRRQAKRDQYLKREQMVLSSLKLKVEEDQKKRIDGLDAIREALLNTTKQSQSATSGAADKPKPGLHGTTSKSKMKLITSEVSHFNLVLQHPAFRANPFATMQEHLRNTLAKHKEQQQEEAQQRAKSEDEDRNKQKLIKKEQLQGTKAKSRKKFKATRTRNR